MKLSLRLMAERGREDRLLGHYLDDPIELFVPARLLLGMFFSLATVLLAVLTGRSGISFASLSTLLACVAIYIVICEHLLPSLIVRRNSEQVLTWLLPSFAFIARAMLPISRPGAPSDDREEAEATRRPHPTRPRGSPAESRARLSRSQRGGGAHREATRNGCCSRSLTSAIPSRAK